MGILNKQEQQDKLKLLEKEKLQFKREEKYYGYWILFLVFMLGLVMYCIVRSK